MIQGTRDLAQRLAGRVAVRWEHHAVHCCSYLNSMRKSFDDYCQTQHNSNKDIPSL